MRIPITLIFDKRLNLDDKKIMVHDYYTIALLMNRIREKILKTKPNQNQALFMLINDQLYPITFTLQQIFKNVDEPYVIHIKMENTFGNYISSNS